MSENRSKQAAHTQIEYDSEVNGFVLEPEKVEIGCGYTVSVAYDAERKPIVDVKTYGEVDIPKLRRAIEKTFPHAKIRQVVQTSTVTVARRKKKKKLPARK